jgi:hypothetical protein
VSEAIGHRVNIVGPPDPPPPGTCADSGFLEEVVTGPSGYLGGFATDYLTPSDLFQIRYPVGWTSSTWYEMPGVVRRASCECNDCQGLHTGTFYGQRAPDEEVTCDDATLFDFWDFAVSPKEYVGSTSCCTVRFRTDQNCFHPDTGIHTGKCNTTPGCSAVAHQNAGWALSTFALANPSSRIRTVADSSGPDGLEDCPAMEIDFSGSGLEGATFIGEGGGLDGTSPPNGYTNGTRSTTGWSITEGSCWVERFWVKAVPDNDGFTCTGYDIRTNVGFWPFPFHTTVIDGDRELILNGDWQEFYFVWQATGWLGAFPDPMLNAPWAILTFAQNPMSPECPEGRPAWQRKGRVHVKQVHIYPCDLTSGVWVKRPSGLRT